MGITLGSFDITSAPVLLRLICALFFFPHMYFKVVGSPPPAINFFIGAGFKPPGFWMLVAFVVELIASVTLFLGIYTPWAALLAAANLLVAAVAVCFFNKGFRWLWNLNGMEFPLFWAICCIVVAMLYWN